jgi:hypothetical protein
MNKSKQELLDKGWKLIGNDGVLEYLAKENEHGEILYIPVHNGYTMGISQSINKNVIRLLSNFISDTDLTKNERC